MPNIMTIGSIMNMSLRQERMRLLALAPETSLDEALSGISLPGYRIVRGPETGLVMARDASAMSAMSST